MFNALRLITWRADSSAADRAQATQRLSEAAKTLPMIRRVLLAPTLTTVSRNGGDLMWHLRFDSEASHDDCIASTVWRNEIEAVLRSPLVSQIEGGTYALRRRGMRMPTLRNGIYRAVLVGVEPGTAPESIARYEAEMATMPDYCTGIRNWSMNALRDCFGQRRLTHIWEQEFDDFAFFAPFTGEYFSHPAHAAYIDLWYDPESPTRIIDYRYACSALCNLETSFLAD